MSKIIIDIKGLISDEDAIKAVAKVINEGLIYETTKHKIKHYCWVTVFGNRLVVESRQKKTHGSANSFIVYKE